MKGEYTVNYDQSGLLFCVGDLLLPSCELSLSTPKILVIHGGGWTSMDRSAFAGVSEFFRSHGFVVFNIDYRLANMSPWPACGDDCLEAARFLIEGSHPALAPCAGSPIFICGGSSGGHLALMTGLRLPHQQVSGIISISGIADYEADYAMNPGRYNALFGGKGIDATAFPAAWLTMYSPPMLLTHQVDDKVVPIQSALTFADKALALGIDVDTYIYDQGRAGQGHGIWVPGSQPRVAYPDLFDAMLRFVNRVMGKPEGQGNFENISYLGKAVDGFRGDVICANVDSAESLSLVRGSRVRLEAPWSRCVSSTGELCLEWLDDLVDRCIHPWLSLVLDVVPGSEDVHGYCGELAKRYAGRLGSLDVQLPSDDFAGDLQKLVSSMRCCGCKVGVSLGSMSYGALLDACCRHDLLSSLDFVALGAGDELGRIGHLRRWLDSHDGSGVAIWRLHSGVEPGVEDPQVGLELVRSVVRNVSCGIGALSIPGLEDIFRGYAVSPSGEEFEAFGINSDLVKHGLSSLSCVFRDGVQGIDLHIGQSGGNNATCFGFACDGKPFFVYWLDESRFEEDSLIDLRLYDEIGLSRLEECVLVDLTMGDVFALGSDNESRSVLFKGLPLARRPMLVCDKDFWES